MGACASTGDPEQERINKLIEEEMRKEQRSREKVVKILLLGTGESGKSTIFKQMKILQKDGGVTPEELGAWIVIIRLQCIMQMKILLSVMSKPEVNESFSAPESEDAARRLTTLPSNAAWSTQIGNDIKTLWADHGVRAAYKLRDKLFHLNDTAAYFFDNMDRINADSYTPSPDDYLRARARTTGIMEAEFHFDRLSFQCVDVGGQRSERRKWIHCFDSVTAVLFCVGMSEYDQKLREDDNTNRMQESLLLFDEIVNSPWFANCSFILFMNKMDLFEEKVKRVNPNVFFKEYTGGNNPEAAKQYVQQHFLNLNVSGHDVFPHFTTAVNTDNMRNVFDDVLETLRKRMLDGFMA